MSKKVSIYDLYKKEKVIKLEDNDGNYTDILIKKLSQNDREEAINVFNKKLIEERQKLEKDSLATENIKSSLEIFNKEQIIQGIIDIEKVARNQISDLLPLEDEENLNKEEREKKQEEEFNKWHDIRKKELEKETNKNLIEQLAQLRINSLSTISASILYNYSCISNMCYDPETKEKIFKNYLDVGNVLDKNIIEKLIKEIDEFRVVQSDKDIREVAEDNDFLSNGESEKNSTDSHTIIEKK
jgi:hypothetical protein